MKLKNLTKLNPLQTNPMSKHILLSLCCLTSNIRNCINMLIIISTLQWILFVSNPRLLSFKSVLCHHSHNPSLWSDLKLMVSSILLSENAIPLENGGISSKWSYSSSSVILSTMSIRSFTMQDNVSSWILRILNKEYLGGLFN